MRTFLLFDGLGAVLWTGGAVALGVVFSDAVEDLFGHLSELGHWALPLIALAIAAFIVAKWIRRRQFLRQLRMARITPDELYALFQNGSRPLIVDVRPEYYRNETGWIPGALFVSLSSRPELPPHDQAVVYCDCPNELSAALLCRELARLGFRDVRPLAGGFEAWRAMGYPIESQI